MMLPAIATKTLVANREAGPVYGDLNLLPRISFIVPSYNQAAYLGICIESILNEGYPKAEIMVSDGGSTDGSKDIIERYKSHLAYARSTPDKGTWDANNQALAQATGDFIWVVNSDDGLLPGAVCTFLQSLAQHPDGTWFAGKVRAVDAGGKERAVWSPQERPKTAGNRFLTECWIYHPATVLHRDLALPYAETDLLDWDLWIRLENAGHAPKIIDAPLAFLRFHEACKSFDTLSILEKQIALLRGQKWAYMGKSSPVERAEYEKLLQKKQLEFEQAQVKTAAFDGHRMTAMRLSARMAMRHAEVLMQRWYWGLVRRIFTGFSLAEVSPLAFLEERAK